MKSRNNGSDELDVITDIYQKGNQILEISNSGMGEMHYGHSYKLMDSKKKVLKTRNFSFSGVGDPKELTESVKDYTSSPAKEYSRTQ